MRVKANQDTCPRATDKTIQGLALEYMFLIA